MGHGCHDCGCPNGCECDGGYKMKTVGENYTLLPGELNPSQNKCCHGTTNCSGKGEKHWCETLRDKSEAMELILICAKDIVNAWPKTTMRTLGEMTKRIDTLRQALEAATK